MSKIKNLADAGYITKTRLVGSAVAEAWSIDDMFENGTITKTGLDPEALAEIAEDQVATPTFSYDDSTTELSVLCATKDALIYVKLNGGSYIGYEGSIDVTHLNVDTVTAQAKKEGYKDSEENTWTKPTENVGE